MLGKGGVGAIARDSNGRVLLSAWRFHDRCASAAEAEAVACVEGLQWAVQWSMPQAIIEPTAHK